MPNATRILIADDDPPLRKLLRVIAERAGFVVDAVSDGADALESVRARNYAVAVVDLMMPHVSGHELIEALGNVRPRPAVLVVSAASDRTLGGLDPAVVSAVVKKPFDVGMFEAVLRDVAAKFAGTSGG